MAININAATYDELLTINGIGPSRAKAIITARSECHDELTWEYLKGIVGVPCTLWDPLIKTGIITLEPVASGGRADPHMEPMTSEHARNLAEKVLAERAAEVDEFKLRAEELAKRENDMRKELDEMKGAFAKQLREKDDQLREALAKQDSKVGVGLLLDTVEGLAPQSIYSHKGIKTGPGTSGKSSYKDPGLVNGDRRGPMKEEMDRKVMFPPYDGRGEWKPFFIQISHLGDRYGWSDSQRLDKLIECLRDKALKYFSSMPVNVQGNFKILCSKMNQCFGKQYLPHVVRRELAELRQASDETLEEYAERVQELAADGYPGAQEDLIQIMATDSFLKGLSDKGVALAVFDKAPSTLHETLLLVKNAVTNQKLIYGSSKLPKSDIRKVSFQADEDDLDEVSVRRIFKNDSWQPESRRENRVQRAEEELSKIRPQIDSRMNLVQLKNRTHSLSTSPTHEHGCFKCGDTGHFARECLRSNCNSRLSRSPSPDTSSLKRARAEAVSHPSARESTLEGSKGAKIPYEVREIQLYSQECIRQRRSLVLPVYLQGKSCRAVVDTAAQVTVVSATFFKTLETGAQLFHSICLRGIGENLVNGRLYNQTCIEIGSIKENIAVVVANIPDQMILGLDFLDKHEAVIDLSVYSVQLDGETFPALYVQDTAAVKTKLYQVQLEGRTVVPPASFKFANVKIVDDPGQNLVVQPNKNMKGLLAPATLQSDSGNIFVKLCYPTDNFVSRNRDHRFGTAMDAVYVCGDTDSKEPDQSPEAKQIKIDHSVSLEDQLVEARSRLPQHLIELFDRSTEKLLPKQSLKVAELLLSFQEIFAKSDLDLGLFSGEIKHRIETGDSKPIRQRIRTPLGFEAKEEGHVRAMLVEGVIQPSVSDRASPPVLVRTKNSSLRYCIDYRALNNVTVKDAFPLPNIAWVGHSPKLRTPWKGPYVVTGVPSPVLYKIRDRKGEIVIHHDRMKELKPTVQSSNGDTFPTESQNNPVDLPSDLPEECPPYDEEADDARRTDERDLTKNLSDRGTDDGFLGSPDRVLDGARRRSCQPQRLRYSTFGEPDLQNLDTVT